MSDKKWTIEFVNKKSELEVLSLSDDLSARFLHVSELLIDFGPYNLGMPYVRPLEKKLWEIRLKGKDNIARLIYVTVEDKRIVILHSFVKKTQKTPKEAISLALKRLKEVEDERI